MPSSKAIVGGPSFSDLIRAREAQQANIRLALARQNARLRDKLTTSREGSPEGNELPHDDEAAGIAAEQDDAVRAILENGEGHGEEGEQQEGTEGEGLSPTKRSQLPWVTIEAFSDVQKLVGSLQALVTSMHEETKSSIESLREEVTTRCDGLESKLSSMEETLAAEERTNAILREEQTEQHLTLCREIDGLRSTTHTLEKRLDARDEVVSALEDATRQFVTVSETYDNRLIALEAFQSSTRKDLGELDDRVEDLKETMTNEQATILQQNTDLNEQRNAEFQDLLKECEDELSVIKSYSKDAVETVKNSKDMMHKMVESGIAEFGVKVEDKLSQRLLEQEDNMNAAHHRHVSQTDAFTATLNDRFAELKQEIEGSLSDIRTDYDSSVKDQLDALVEKADEHERQRREAFPTLDGDRMAIMLQELQGAQVMIEGIARNTMGVGHKCPLSNRLHELEAKVDELTVPDASSDGPKVNFAVEVQTEFAGGDYSSSPGTGRNPVERRLAVEMERAASERQDAKLWKNIEEAENRGNANAAPSSSAPRGVSTVSEASPSAPSPSAALRSVNVDEVRAAIRVRQSQLEKIQQVLRSIQQKFQELTQKEARSSSVSSSADRSASVESRRVAELIAKQKETVYLHERQLLDQRNKILHELRELTLREDELSR